MAAKTIPAPDEFGRFRVRIKGDKRSPSWSTVEYNPEVHVVAGGPASDCYGNALPERPYWPDDDVARTEVGGHETPTDEESADER